MTYAEIKHELLVNFERLVAEHEYAEADALVQRLRLGGMTPNDFQVNTTKQQRAAMRRWKQQKTETPSPFRVQRVMGGIYDVFRNGERVARIVKQDGSGLWQVRYPNGSTGGLFPTFAVAKGIFGL